MSESAAAPIPPRTSSQLSARHDTGSSRASVGVPPLRSVAARARPGGSIAGSSYDGVPAALVNVRLWAVPEVVRVGLETMLADHADRVRLVPDDSDERAQVTLVDPLAPGADLVPHAGEVPVVALTWDASPRAVHRARTLGAVRVVPISTSAADLVEILVQVHRSTSADAGRTPSYPQAGDHWSPEGLLSGREAQIVERICRGMSNDEIAAELYLSINSVKTYIRTAYRKIGVTRRSQAVLWGIEHGL